MKVNKYLLMSLIVISTGGILTFANADSTMTSNDVAHAATTQVADDAVPDGTIVTPMKVVKAPDPVIRLTTQRLILRNTRIFR